MTVYNLCGQTTPEYYPEMYKDGYSLTTILDALHDKFIRECEAREQENQSVDSITIISEVKVR